MYSVYIVDQLRPKKNHQIISKYHSFVVNDENEAEILIKEQISITNKEPIMQTISINCLLMMSSELINPF